MLEKYDEKYKRLIIKDETIDFSKKYTGIISNLALKRTQNRLAFIMVADSSDKKSLQSAENKYFVVLLSVTYNAVLNDSRVRLRSSPDLSGKTLALLSKSDALKIIDRSEEKYTIDGESWYWYKVETDDYPDGWIYGKYVDIEK